MAAVYPGQVPWTIPLYRYSMEAWVANQEREMAHACGPHRRQVQLGRMEDTVGSWWKMAQILELDEKTVRNAPKAEP